MSIDNEIQRRMGIWEQLRNASAEGDGRNLTAGAVNELRAFYGGRGIWRHKEVTESCTDDGHGLTVGVLHTGKHYEDDIDEQGGIYHYPDTEQANHDKGDVEGTKNCKRHRVPLFVVIRPTPSSKLRHVNLGWVLDWDDEARWFLIECGQDQPAAPTDIGIDDIPFSTKDDKNNKGRKSEVEARPHQRKFKVDVFKRYGPCCAVSGLQVKEMLDAAHVIPKSKQGPDDPRNGLVLSASHHRAYDSGLWAIHPESLEIVTKPNGPSMEDLGIALRNLEHLENLPHRDALKWAWKNVTADWGDKNTN